MKKLNEIGSTSFGGHNSDVPTTSGFRRLGRFFAKIAKKAFDDAELNKDEELPSDTVDGRFTFGTDGAPLVAALGRSNIFPEIEYLRKDRYKKFEEMDEYPEIGSAFDVYADDCTQISIEKKRWIIKCENTEIVDVIEELFRKLDLKSLYWEIFRNMCKYGDCFIELIVDLQNQEAGIKKVKILDPNFIYRVEDEKGTLLKYMQEIPQEGDAAYMTFENNENRFINLDKNQLTHFRLFTSDPAFYPYGRSIAGHAVRIFRSLKLMEDAMLIYRLSRAPERKVFYVDTGNLPSAKAEAYIERLKDKYKKEKFFNAQTGNIDARYNPAAVDEDFFLAVRSGNNSKIDTLPGAQNLGEVDDVKYFRDKLLASLKIPKDYVVEKDKSPERKANLSQLDAKFSRVIERVQSQGAKGLEELAKKHLILLGYSPADFWDLEIELPDPSDVFTKRKLELDLAKMQVVQTVQALQLFPPEFIYTEYFNMTEEEAEAMLERMNEYKMEQMEMGAMNSMMTSGAESMPGGNPQVPSQGTQGVPKQEQEINAIEFLLNEEKRTKNIKVLERINKRLSKSKEKALEG